MYRLIQRLALFLAALLTGILPAAARPARAPRAAAVQPVAKPAAAVSAAVTAAASAARPALWKVADADTTIWLFGTIHVLPPGLEWLNGPVAEALSGSQQLVTELPDTPGPDMQAAVMANALLPEGQTLRGLLSAEDRARYERGMTKAGLELDTFDRFRPWFAAISLAMLPVKAGGFDIDSGADVRIAAQAKAKGVPRTGLETAQYQMALFAGLPAEVQKRYLIDVIEGLPGVAAEMNEMVRQWAAGQPERVAQLDNADENDPRMLKALLTDRNAAWAKWIEARLAQPGTVFMAVGTGHLAGKDSVQDMLAKAGVTVTRVQ